MTSAFVSAVTVGLIAMAGEAEAQSPRPPLMPLGDAAPAPVGYLSFCAARPDQCGLPAEVEVRGQPIRVDDRSRELISKYFWGIVFGSTQPPDLRLTPTAGAPSSPATAAAWTGGRYDWSAAFGDSPAAATNQGRPEAIAVPPGAQAGEPPALAAREEMRNERAFASVATDAPAAARSERGPTVAVRPLQANPALLAELDRVNSRINRAIRYVSDRTLYGNEDFWHLPLDVDGRGEGDCKDYVLEKRRALVADGVPSADLSIAIVETPRGETHALLLVATDRGELVLDNLSSSVKPWQAVHYRWIERQAPGQPLNWVKLG